MAPSVAARGKVYKALRRGEGNPTDWALDKDGKLTDDPAKALEGVMMDVFSGVLSGSAFAGHVTNPYDASQAADVGDFMVAIRPDLFMSIDEFKDRMDYLCSPGWWIGPNCKVWNGSTFLERWTKEKRLKFGSTCRGRDGSWTPSTESLTATHGCSPLEIEACTEFAR